MRAAFVFLILLLLSCSVMAQEVGDTIVVVAPEAKLKLQSGEVDKVPRGNHLKVQVVNGNWYWVLWHGKKAWIHRKDIIPVDEGITYFTQAIRQNPNPTDYNIRGMIWEDRGELDKALADYNEAIRLDPKYVSPYENRGMLRAEGGDFERALADFNRAIQLDPKSAGALYNRSNAYTMLGQFERAIADYEQALALDPDYVDALNGLAWLLATAADASYRDGKRAVEFASKACELTNWKEAGSIDTLAAAHAETGNFEEAVKLQQQAVDLATDEQKDGYQSRLALYQEGQPYHESSSEAN